MTADVERQAAFYGKTLGLPVTLKDTAAMVQVGDSRLEFAAAPAGWTGAYHFAFNIPDNQLAAAKAWLAPIAALVTDAGGVDTFDFANWEAEAVYFYDAAGNIVELIARRALGNGTDAAFGPGSLLNVSEIGLACPDVPAAVRHFAQALGVDVFRGSSSETFAAVGSETGLFILVYEGRAWYPDLRVPADPAPMVLTVAMPSRRRYMVEGPPYAVAEVAG